MWITRDTRALAPVVLSLAALAWLALLLWSQTPWQRYLGHQALEGVRLDRHAAVFLAVMGGWTLMTVAMMLPSSLPFIAGFHRLSAGCPGAAGRTSLLIAAGVALLAGLWQLAPAKRHFLARMQAPPSAAGHPEPGAALGLGWRHGLICVGCCWPLMLLMLAAGHGNLALMAPLAAVMTLEKHPAWGRDMREPLGIALLAAGIVLLVL